MKPLPVEQLIQNDARWDTILKRRFVTYAVIWTALLGFVIGFLVGMLRTK